MFSNIIRTYGDDAQGLVTIFSIVYPLVLLLIIVVAGIPIGWLYYIHRQMYSDRNQSSKFPTLSRRFKAAIISIIIISFVRLLFINFLDGAAVYYTVNLSDSKLIEIHNTDNAEHGILYIIPIVLLLLDLMLFAVYAGMVCIIPAILSFEFTKSDNGYYWLILSLLNPFASICLHLPFIAIAYLNDANYAGSALILYIIITFVEFITLEFIFIQWLKLEQVDKKHYCSFIIIVSVSLLLIYCIVCISVCFFYYLPIHQSISSTSNQIITIYQTGLIILGAAITYKTFFRRRNVYIKALVKNEGNIKKNLLCDVEKKQKWDKSTDQEKLTMFIGHIITDVIPRLKVAN